MVRDLERAIVRNKQKDNKKLSLPNYKNNIDSKNNFDKSKNPKMIH